MKRLKKFEELYDLKPVTDEELKELLDDKPREERKRKKRKTFKKS